MACDGSAWSRQLLGDRRYLLLGEAAVEDPEQGDVVLLGNARGVPRPQPRDGPAEEGGGRRSRSLRAFRDRWVGGEVCRAGTADAGGGRPAAWQDRVDPVTSVMVDEGGVDVVERQRLPEAGGDDVGDAERRRRRGRRRSTRWRWPDRCGSGAGRCGPRRWAADPQGTDPRERRRRAARRRGAGSRAGPSRCREGEDDVLHERTSPVAGARGTGRSAVGPAGVPGRANRAMPARTSRPATRR